MEKEVAVLLILSGIRSAKSRAAVIKRLKNKNPALDEGKIEMELARAEAYENQICELGSTMSKADQPLP